MEVEHHVHVGQQLLLDEMGDHLRQRPVRIAGEAAVQVALVDGRGSPARARGRIVRHREHDEVTLHRFGLQAARELAQRDLSFVLVAVVPAHQQYPWTVAVLD